MSNIVYFYRQDIPDYSGENYGWDAEYENGRVDWIFNLREARQIVKKLHRGYHSSIRPKYGPDFDEYRKYGWSIYWGKCKP